MKIVLKKFITRSFLADRVGIHTNTLSRKMEEVTGVKHKKRALLTSEQVNAFFNYFQLDPKILGEDVADIYDYPDKIDLASKCQVGKIMP